MIKQLLLDNLDKIHTTPMGADRIRRNAKLAEEIDVVGWCKDILQNQKSIVELKGKNYYCRFFPYILTINKYSFTIITAHLERF